MKDVLIGQGYSLDKMQEIPQDIVKLAEVKADMPRAMLPMNWPNMNWTMRY